MHLTTYIYLVIKPKVIVWLRPVQIIFNKIYCKLYTLLKPYIKPIYTFVYKTIKSLIKYIYKIYNIIYNTYTSIYRILCTYTYISINTHRLVTTTGVVCLCLSILSYKTDLIIFNLTEYYYGVKSQFIEEIEIPQIEINLQTCIVYTILYICIYIVLENLLSNYINPVKWYLMFIFILITLQYIPSIESVINLAATHVLTILLLIQFLPTNTHIFFKTQNIFICVGNMYLYITLHVHTYIHKIRFYCKKQIGWVPVFKKNSYFGLYKTFKNK